MVVRILEKLQNCTPHLHHNMSQAVGDDVYRGLDMEVITNKTPEFIKKSKLRERSKIP